MSSLYVNHYDTTSKFLFTIVCVYVTAILRMYLLFNSPIFCGWIWGGWTAAPKITDSYLRMIIDAYYFIWQSWFCQKCYQYHLSGCFMSRKSTCYWKPWFGCSACQKLRFMNTNNISKDGRLYVAACRVIDNFRYEHDDSKSQLALGGAKSGKKWQIYTRKVILFEKSTILHM